MTSVVINISVLYYRGFVLFTKCFFNFMYVFLLLHQFAFSLRLQVTNETN